VKTKTFWLIPVIVVALIGPWMALTRQFFGMGIIDYTPPGIWDSLRQLTLNAGTNLPWLWPFFLLGSWRLVRQKAISGYTAMLLAYAPCVFLFLAMVPVSKEPRYLIPAFPAMIVLAGHGVRWLAERLARGGSVSRWTATIFGLATLPQAFAGLVHQPLPPDNDIRAVAEYILSREAFANASVLVSSRAEGPMIAELAMLDPHRPQRLLCRPNKIFAQVDWLHIHYQSHITSKEDVLAVFDRIPVDLTILPKESPQSMLPHERLLLETVQGAPERWVRIELPGNYDIYRDVKPKHVSEAAMLGELRDALLSRRFGRPLQF
jgi:hypothetical protein